jgi:hypothetical protein
MPTAVPVSNSIKRMPTFFNTTPAASISSWLGFSASILGESAEVVTSVSAVDGPGSGALLIPAKAVRAILR